MHDGVEWSRALGGLAALAVAAGLLAMLLRRAAVPGGAAGAAIAGGVLAGLLLGPAVLGRISPQWFQPVFEGGVRETAALNELIREQQREMNALGVTGVSRAAVNELQQQHEVARSGAQNIREAALNDHAERWSILAAGVTGLYLLFATVLVMPARSARWKRLATTLVLTTARPLLAGWLAVAIAGLPVAVLAMWLLRWEWPAAVALALAFAAPGLSAMLGPTTFLLGAGGLFATFVTGAVVGWNVGFTIGIAGAFFGLLAILGIDFPRLRMVRVLARPAALGVLLPLLAALGANRIDLHHLNDVRAFWLALIAGVLWSSDGRWMAARLMLALSRTRRQTLDRPWAHAASSVDAGASAVQVCTAILLAQPALLPMEAVFGAMVGAGVIEFTREMRGSIARHLDARG